MSDPVDFYGGPFSNFAFSPFTIPHPWAPDEEIRYPCVENFYQAMKATTRQAHDAIALEPNTWTAKRMGNTTTLRADWEEIKYAVMLQGLREKFKIPEFREELLATGDALIREDSPTDFIWGYRSADGTDSGQNLLGLALMQIREEIQVAVEASQAAWGEHCDFCGWCDKPGACVWSIECPLCHAEPKQKCIKVHGQPVGLHQARWDAVE